MAANPCVTEEREVSGFDRVVLRVYNLLNEVQIVQGERELLSIEAPPEILAGITTDVSTGQLVIKQEVSLSDRLGFALSTSLTRPTVRYLLTVKNLVGLDLAGLVHADAAELRCNHLALRLKGAGEVAIGLLIAQHLAVDLQGVGRIDISGQVEEQHVAIQGPGSYQAHDLKSQRTSLKLKGIGSASIWAVDDLAVKVRGLGQVEVRGTPVIKRDISPRVPVPSFRSP